MTDRTILAIDAGQTGMKLRLESPGASVRERTLAGVRTDEPLIPQLAAAARTVADGMPVAEVVAGVSGLTRRESDAADLLRATRDLGADAARLAHDSVTSFLGTLGGGRGVVVAAGTGAVTLAVGHRAVARVDGWGNIMGDAGSAYWIGRAGLEAGMRAYDGRGPRTALTESIRELWTDLDDAYIQLQADPDRVRVVAAIARTVAELADEDAVSAGICRAAAQELAHSAVTAIGRVADVGEEPGDPWAVAAVGGVFASPLIRGRFEELLGAASVPTRLQQPRGTGLDGAAALADLAPQHPLRSLVSVAGAAR